MSFGLSLVTTPPCTELAVIFLMTANVHRSCIMTSRWHKVKTVYNSVSRAFRHDARRNPAGQLAVYELVATIHSIHGDCTRLTNTISRPWYSMLWLWLIAPSCRSDAASAAASGLMGCDAGMSLTSFSDLRSVALAASLTQVTGNDRLTAMTHA